MTATALDGSTVADFDFFAGHWQGEGFVMHFAPPYAGMIFGSMQAADGNYWETFRLAEEEGAVFFYPTQKGKPVGRYRLVELTRDGEARRAVFEDPDARMRRLTYATERTGAALVAGVEGEKDGKPYRESWRLTRA